MILIVDDKPENIFALKSILAAKNFETDSAQSGEEALHKILKNSYSLIILDVQMPEMDGFEVAEFINGYSKSKRIPIIFLTAISKDKEFVQRGYKVGAVDYITKPVDADILLLKVTSLYSISNHSINLRENNDQLNEEIKVNKQIQSELSEKNLELQSILESLPQLAFTLNSKGEIEYTNQSWKKIFDHETTLPELSAGSAEAYKAWEKAFANGNNFTSEVKIKGNANISSRHFLLKIVPVKRDNVINKWVGTLTDIQYQKEVNEILEQKVAERTVELQQKNRELEIFNNEFQQLSWVLSHDMKEPLRKIMTYNSLIKEKISHHNYDFFDEMNRISRSTEKMSELINGLADFSYIPSSTVLEEVNLNAVIKQVIRNFDKKINEYNVEITHEPLPVIHANHVHMQQVFSHLISNAIKFRKPNEKQQIMISCEIIDNNNFEGAPLPEGNYWKFTVSDTGVGFRQDFRDKIFKVFQKLDNSGSGTGIGLALIKKIIEKYQGQITATSEENVGSKFVFILPKSL